VGAGKNEGRDGKFVIRIRGPLRKPNKPLEL
jgi:hypothetical protein